MKKLITALASVAVIILCCSTEAIHGIVRGGRTDLAPLNGSRDERGHKNLF